MTAESRRVDGMFDAQETAVNAALVAQEKAVAAALAASEKAVNKAETAQGNVNETQNEFRGSLKDQAATQMPRAEAEVTFRELRGLITTQGELINTLRSRLDVGPPSLGVLQARSDNDAGRRSSSTQGWVYVAMAFSIFFGLAGLGFAILTALSR
jgi:Flp pilus assembly protein TadB